MSMNPDPQPQGLFGGIGQGLRNMFGGGQPDPNAGNPTDPFEGLSRSQRTMLGFAALRDAAASLEGRDSNFFNEALGGFEAARERERLRAQGLFANQVQAVQALIGIENEIGLAQAYGREPSPAQVQLRNMLYASVYGDGGVPSAAAGGAGGATPMPVDFTGGTTPTTGLSTATGPIAGDEFLAEMERTGAIGVDAQGNPMPEAQPAPAATPAPAPSSAPAPNGSLAEVDAQIAALENRMLEIAARNGDPSVLNGQMQRLLDQREAIAGPDAIEAAQATERAAAQAENVILPNVQEAMDFLVQGYDDEGNVIFNPALLSRAGRFVAGALEGPEYQNFVGAIETLKTGVLLDALARATVGALSEGERTALSAEQGRLDPSDPIGTLRALQNIDRISRESIERRNREAGITGDTAAPSAPSVTWD